MNTYSNFSSINGWQLPGSGAWIMPDEECCYADENGDLWIPCFCDATGTTGTTGATGADATEFDETPATEEARTESQPAAAAQIIYKADTSGDFVCVGYPEAILYYPGRSLKSCRLGMLADCDKGSRWYYKGPHSGKVRFYINQRNMTQHAAVWDGRVYVPENGIYPGVELYYAVLFENAQDTPARVTIAKQGTGIGMPPCTAAENYFASEAEPAFIVLPKSRKWLYLGRKDESGPCVFLTDEDKQVRIAPNDQAEALLDLEIDGRLMVLCCAYHDKAKVDFSQRMWPLPSGCGVPHGTTGISRTWQLEGSFTWVLDDESYGTAASLDITPARAALDLAVPVAAPAAGNDPEVMLFVPPPGPIAGEARSTGCGVLFRHRIAIENNGLRARRVQYHVLAPEGEWFCAAIHNPDAGRVLCYDPAYHAGPFLAGEVTVPPLQNGEINIQFILSGSGGGLRHQLTIDDQLA